MTNQLTVALGHALKKPILEAARGKLKPGTYKIDAGVRLKGAITIEEDYQVTPTVSIPLKATLALFIRHAGIGAERAMKALAAAAEEAMEKKEEAILAEAPEVAKTLAAVQERILAKLPKAKRKGKVLAELVVEDVGTKRRASR